jgi:hypothetical protein
MGQLLARLRPTPAMAVALAALVVALGGSAYAVTKVDGRSLKNRSVPAAKIKANALTGAEINERRLGRVPRSVTAVRSTTARSAEFATMAAGAAIASSANNAERLGGLPPASYAVGRLSHRALAGAAGQDDLTVLSVPGLGAVEADCGASDATIRFRNASGATLTGVVHDAGSAVPPATQVANGGTLTLATSRLRGITTAVLWSAQPETTLTLTVANAACSFSAQASANR